jgi:phosphate-selective porin
MKGSLYLLTSFLLLTFCLHSQTAVTPVSNDSVLKSVEALRKDLAFLKNLKISGWVQIQYQHIDSAGAASMDGGDFLPNSDSRFMIRRGRVRFAWEGKQVQYVAQINMTDRFMNMADLYVKYTEPFTKWVSLQVGLTNRPFGYDIALSSAFRESPERTRYTQLLFPNERDVGAELIIEAPKTSKWYGLQITGGFFNGTGLVIPNNGFSDIDSRKDFIGRICYYRGLRNDKIRVGLGASHYNGYERVANNQLFDRYCLNDATGTRRFMTANTSAHNVSGTYAQRLYYGAEAFFSIKSPLGMTTLRGEYVCGQQPGSTSSSKSPQAPTAGATYLRQFNAAYLFFIQRIAKSKHELVARYEWHDPNTKVTGRDIGVSGSNLGAADLRYTALGLGYNFYLNEHFKFMAYYNIVRNESAAALPGYTGDLKDNVLTLRVQAKF